MLSDGLGQLLKEARHELGMSRDALAAKAGVSLRLVAEFERGQRGNVALESALRLLKAVGITIIAKTPEGAEARIRGTGADRLERAARAEQRRRTWTGRIVPLEDSGDPPAAPRSLSRRVVAVAEVSATAYAIGSRARERADGPTKQRDRA